jgi:hypothetical protein
MTSLRGLAAALLAGTLTLAANSRAQTPPPPPPVAVPSGSEPPISGNRQDDAFDEAVRVIPDVESRTEQVIDGRRVIRVTTRTGLQYELIEDGGVVVSTLLAPDSQRFRVPMWRLFEW